MTFLRLASGSGYWLAVLGRPVLCQEAGHGLDTRRASCVLVEVLCVQGVVRCVRAGRGWTAAGVGCGVGGGALRNMICRSWSLVLFSARFKKSGASKLCCLSSKLWFLKSKKFLGVAVWGPHKNRRTGGHRRTRWCS